MLVFALVVLAQPCLVFANTNDVAVEHMRIVQPRSFGYQIGDTFSRVIDIRVRKPYTVETESLPETGRLTDWLSVHAPIIETTDLGDATRYEIVVTYQLVNVNHEFTNIAIPHIDLIVSKPNDSIKTLVPATRVRVSPLISDSGDTLQDDQPPARIVQNKAATGMLAAFLVFLLAIIVNRRWGFPWSDSGPFTRSYRRLRGAQLRSFDHETYTRTLKDIHHAFNESAGKTMFVDDVPEFLATHERYQSLDSQVSDYFSHSRDYFFADESSMSVKRYSPDDLLALVRSLSEIERGSL